MHDLIHSGSPLLKNADAAKLIGKSESWLNQSRMKGNGPRYLKLGGGVFYRLADIEAWLDAQSRTRVWDFGGEAA